MLQKLAQKIAFTSIVAFSSLSLLAQSAMASKDNFRVINDSRTDIVRLYISESSADFWFPVTGVGRLRSGYNIPISFNNLSPYACRYDIRAVFANGDVLDSYYVNVCSGNFRFYDTW